ncbi:D-beta-D-heptose 7-phosphate kinase / D-beta-D-heptose 1-phosphate adenosyltransferase [Arachidicoccus rhizosphaerae]|uniref:D-glycero-beta-D-manno-heptose 1-phosphate adenylyltransferase n=1 Tax=Arachidicoccus rhizosphaerae TaxID=551991 RepID=A0A1H3YJE9_9BACT|nr:D-glycero-beta-D-manno-heptose 1-phosphate adenylyltransferase [Arachidicoccus rhizosphaerae]SEA11675.1 D-beta-D-heptose 7-phosphate kinase / D-beta-D-heptose 1-phosphate adenosyltransferase [Arachidicoccus rhizosphaerae]
MKITAFAGSKVYSLEDLKRVVAGWRLKGKKVAFTNGCFDILHAGHLVSLNEAAAHGDCLIVAVNSDASIRHNKGEGRPINKEQDRALLLASMTIVDAVVIFDEPTPLLTIQALMPDVLVKGGDYTIDQVVGAKEVQANGGTVIINPILEGYSSTATLKKLKGSHFS